MLNLKLGTWTLSMSCCKIWRPRVVATAISSTPSPVRSRLLSDKIGALNARVHISSHFKTVMKALNETKLLMGATKSPNVKNPTVKAQM